jgi:hypothetical protein
MRQRPIFDLSTGRQAGSREQSDSIWVLNGRREGSDAWALRICL